MQKSFEFLACHFFFCYNHTQQLFYFHIINFTCCTLVINNQFFFEFYVKFQHLLYAFYIINLPSAKPFALATAIHRITTQGYDCFRKKFAVKKVVFCHLTKNSCIIVSKWQQQVFLIFKLQKTNQFAFTWTIQILYQSKIITVVFDVRKFWIKKTLVFHNNLYANKTKSVTKNCLKIEKKQA